MLMRVGRPARWGAAVAVAAGFCAASVGPAAAEAGGQDGGPSAWQPFHAAPFEQKAGDVCSFALKGDIVEDGERIRTLAWDAAGRPAVQQVTGPLTIRFTNLSTGAWVVRAVPGIATMTYHPDGSQTWSGTGHMAVAIHTGNPYDPPGEYILNGRIELELHPGVGAEPVALQGTSENLRDTLAG
ncbi:hypothetical protein SLA_2046 [Streptomyces laurentii]|uniref:Uncharacterized protein n=1 Tax=Streptomyces laurentii TaxID=39478 RepID=A0A160NYK9_STRLU|nr:hypothetical protein SLA_2046 [Streptomyces laurentii]